MISRGGRTFAVYRRRDTVIAVAAAFRLDQPRRWWLGARSFHLQPRRLSLSLSLSLCLCVCVCVCFWYPLVEPQLCSNAVKVVFARSERMGKFNSGV